jgi:hypothetical protein
MIHCDAVDAIEPQREAALRGLKKKVTREQHSRQKMWLWNVNIISNNA